LGLELALGTTKIRRFALNAANCRYLSRHYFVQNDIVVSVGGIGVSTESELKEAYSLARDNHDVIVFIVKREIGNIQPELEIVEPVKNITSSLAPQTVQTVQHSLPLVNQNQFQNQQQQQSQPVVSQQQQQQSQPVVSQQQVQPAAPVLSQPVVTHAPQPTATVAISQPLGRPAEEAASGNNNNIIVDYGPNPYGIKTSLRIETVREALPADYRKALLKVEKRGWAGTKWDRGYTLLHWAARNGDKELCMFLIAALGADPTMRDDRGLTPKDHASKKGYGEVVALFTDQCRI